MNNRVSRMLFVRTFLVILLFLITGPAMADGDGLNSVPGVDLPIGAGGSTIMTLTAASQNVGIGTTTPASKLQVNGFVQVGDESSTPCSSATQGALRYYGSAIQYCNGSSWIPLSQSPIECSASMGGSWSVVDCVNTLNGKLCQRGYGNAGGGFTAWQCGNGAGWSLTGSEPVKCDGNYENASAFIGCVGLYTGTLCVRYPSTSSGGLGSWDCSGTSAVWPNIY